MGYPELGKHYGLAVKVETTRGNYATPTMADDAIVLAAEPEVRHGYVLPGARDGVAVGGYGTPPSATPLGEFCRVRFTTELLGSGAAATPPRWGRLLRPFMSETATTDVDYDISSAAETTLSALLQRAGKQYTIVGAVPESLVIRGGADDPRILVDCTLAGKMQAAPTEQALQSQGFQDTNPVVFQGAFTVAAVVMKYEEFELDFGLSARPWRVDRNTTDPLLHGVVTDVNPMIRFPAEVEALATHNPFTRQAAPQTALAFSQRLGTAAGRRYLITAAHAEYVAGQELPLEARNGILYYGLQLRFARPASGTFLQVTHD